jgi:hypothetical protein
LQKGQGRYTVLLREIPEMPAIATVPTAHELGESSHHPFCRANV